MKLRDILKNVNYKKIYGNIDIDIKNLSVNSKNVLEGGLFIAIEGFRYNGRHFAQEAISNGSVAVMARSKVEAPSYITQILTANTREVLPILCRNFYRDPSKYLKLVGVTGTNGKTTTCYLINSILSSAGMKTSIITTVDSFLNGKRTSFDCTTPESLDLNKFFKKSRQEKVDAVCMEVSSHSIDLHRVDYLKFDYFVFTNLSQDHLDYHKNMENYFNTKNKLFLKKFRKIYGGKRAVVNMDDNYGRRILKSTDLKKISYSLKSDSADIRGSHVENSTGSINMNIRMGGDRKFKISSPLRGYFNMYNILAAVGACLDMGIDNRAIQEGVESMPGVNGRFEKVDAGKGPNVIVDYAHTPDGLENVLKTAAELLKPGGKVISVFGCGGDRDKQKRKVMGCISGQQADFTIITSDNPRTEEPGLIIKMIEEGMVKSGSRKYMKETDRRKAIFKALGMAGINDVVIIAGKGHEDYQEFNGYRVPFCDREVVREWVAKKNE